MFGNVKPVFGVFRTDSNIIEIADEPPCSKIPFCVENDFSDSESNSLDHSKLTDRIETIITSIDEKQNANETHEQVLFPFNDEKKDSCQFRHLDRYDTLDPYRDIDNPENVSSSSLDNAKKGFPKCRNLLPDGDQKEFSEVQSIKTLIGKAENDNTESENEVGTGLFKGNKSYQLVHNEGMRPATTDILLDSKNENSKSQCTISEEHVKKDNQHNKSTDLSEDSPLYQSIHTCQDKDMDSNSACTDVGDGDTKSDSNALSIGHDDDNDNWYRSLASLEDRETTACNEMAGGLISIDSSKTSISENKTENGNENSKHVLSSETCEDHESHHAVQNSNVCLKMLPTDTLFDSVCVHSQSDNESMNIATERDKRNGRLEDGAGTKWEISDHGNMLDIEVLSDNGGSRDSSILQAPSLDIVSHEETCSRLNSKIKLPNVEDIVCALGSIDNAYEKDEPDDDTRLTLNMSCEELPNESCYHSNDIVEDDPYYSDKDEDDGGNDTKVYNEIASGVKEPLIRYETGRNQQGILSKSNITSVFNMYPNVYIRQAVIKTIGTLNNGKKNAVRVISEPIGNDVIVCKKNDLPENSKITPKCVEKINDTNLKASRNSRSLLNHIKLPRSSDTRSLLNTQNMETSYVNKPLGGISVLKTSTQSLQNNFGRVVFDKPCGDRLIKIVPTIKSNTGHVCNSSSKDDSNTNQYVPVLSNVVFPKSNTKLNADRTTLVEMKNDTDNGNSIKTSNDTVKSLIYRLIKQEPKSSTSITNSNVHDSMAHTLGPIKRVDKVGEVDRGGTICDVLKVRHVDKPSLKRTTSTEKKRVHKLSPTQHHLLHSIKHCVKHDHNYSFPDSYLCPELFSTFECTKNQYCAYMEHSYSLFSCLGGYVPEPKLSHNNDTGNDDMQIRIEAVFSLAPPKVVKCFEYCLPTNTMPFHCLPDMNDVKILTHACQDKLLYKRCYVVLETLQTKNSCISGFRTDCSRSCREFAVNRLEIARQRNLFQRKKYIIRSCARKHNVRVKIVPDSERQSLKIYVKQREIEIPREKKCVTRNRKQKHGDIKEDKRSHVMKQTTKRERKQKRNGKKRVKINQEKKGKRKKPKLLGNIDETSDNLCNPHDIVGLTKGEVQRPAVTVGDKTKPKIKMVSLLDMARTDQVKIKPEPVTIGYGDGTESCSLQQKIKSEPREEETLNEKFKIENFQAASTSILQNPSVLISRENDTHDKNNVGDVLRTLNNKRSLTVCEYVSSDEPSDKIRRLRELLKEQETAVNEMRKRMTIQSATQ